MHTILLVMAFCQTADLAAPSRGNLTSWNKSIDAHSQRLAKLTHDGKFSELKTMLAKLQSLYSKASDDGYEIVAMSTFLNAIIQEDGYQHDSELRSVCLPFAETIVNKELPVPAPADLHEAQIFAYLNVLSQRGVDASRRSLLTDDKLRKERVRILVTIWDRVVESRQHNSKEFPPELIAEINSGETRLQLPRLPPSLDKLPLFVGQAPDGIQDPAMRKEYKDYLDRCQAVNTRFIAARGVMELNRHLSGLRKHLEILYGKDRGTWNELREIIASTVEDQELAEQIRKDLTRTKQP